MSEKLYEIYKVSYKGQVVYVESGLQGVRHLHVKSGASHVPALNKLFFEDADNMIVNILRDGLSKEESLELEKSYILAIKPEFNTVYTDNFRKAVINGTKNKSRRKSFRSTSK